MHQLSRSIHLSHNSKQPFTGSNYLAYILIVQQIKGFDNMQQCDVNLWIYYLCISLHLKLYMAASFIETCINQVSDFFVFVPISCVISSNLYVIVNLIYIFGFYSQQTVCVKGLRMEHLGSLFTVFNFVLGFLLQAWADVKRRYAVYFPHF